MYKLHIEPKKDYSIGIAPVYRNAANKIYICLVRHAILYS